MSHAARVRQKGPFGEAFGLVNLVGIVLGAISVFNLITKTIHFGVNPIIADILTTYKWLFHDVVLGMLWKLFHISVPAWLNDVIVFWSIMSAIASRTLKSAFDIYQNSVDITAGEIERYVFGLKEWSFALLVWTLCLLLWPVLFLRFAYSKPMTVFQRSITFDGSSGDPGEAAWVLLVGSVFVSAMLGAIMCYFLNPFWAFGVALLFLSSAAFFIYRNANRRNYRTIWLIQISTMALFILILLVTNAGLPSPGS